MNALKQLLKKSSKSESFSKIFHAEANQYFEQKKYFDALHSYNKSLCHAKPNSVDLVNAYTGRSAVYFEMKRYADSLENIRLARIQTVFVENANLDERESCCNEYLKGENFNNAGEKLSLSYAAHSRVPFLANCLELNEDVKFGRYIKTNRDLRPGDVVAIEEPLLKFIGVKARHIHRYQRCYNCFKSNHLNLLPGPHSVMSCSQACHDLSAEKNLDFDELIETELDWKVVKMIRIKDNSLEVTGGLDKLQELYYGGTKTLFDFDLSHLHEGELQNALLKCSISLIGGTNGKTDSKLDVFKLMIGAYDERYRDFLVQYVGYMMNVCRKTQFSLNMFDEQLGQFEKIAHEKFVFIVAKPIRAGEQLFICYRKTFLEEPLASRQKALLEQYGFKCDCPACKLNYQPKINASMVNGLQMEYIRDHKAHSIRAEVMKNWNELESCFDKHTPHETAEIIVKNKFLLEFMNSKFM
ncbi:uncharacterized protein LOC119071216 isoform X2 [Bradysia coprophila]|uniref:uncharacterized protein LOC119071216 isoform X2 n=1 Tax=Bradysia coprophila TaxID=38358 RepID=UPI00187D9AF4|nr:uncharacterized protein LOC119071216 isoform X2 [Bradysia coprophila]